MRRTKIPCCCFHFHPQTFVSVPSLVGLRRGIAVETTGTSYRNVGLGHGHQYWRFGLKTGFVALMPAGNVPSIVATGKVTLEPKVVDGEVKIRNILPMTGTFDHRCFDGSHIGALGPRIGCVSQ